MHSELGFVGYHRVMDAIRRISNVKPRRLLKDTGLVLPLLVDSLSHILGEEYQTTDLKIECTGIAFCSNR
jgi:hypothetical protein